MSSCQKPGIKWINPLLSFDAIARVMFPDVDKALLNERSDDLRTAVLAVFKQYNELFIGDVVVTDVEPDEFILLEFIGVDRVGSNESGIMTCARRCFLRKYEDLEVAKTQQNDLKSYSVPYVEEISKYIQIEASVVEPA